jgi:hypothetical protein
VVDKVKSRLTSPLFERHVVDLLDTCAKTLTESRNLVSRSRECIVSAKQLLAEINSKRDRPAKKPTPARCNWCRASSPKQQTPRH